MSTDINRNLFDPIVARYSDAEDLNIASTDADILRSMVNRGSCRSFAKTPIPENMLNLLCAAALASPTKSDLQQRDIIMLKSQEQRDRLAALLPEQAWVADAPMLLIFRANNRRQRLLHDWSGIPFANDHLDAFLNASADAAIALGTFVTAAEAVGLGCCPISAVRNDSRAVSQLLHLPEGIFPFAGLAVGYPSTGTRITKRLPLKATCHTDVYREANLRETIEAYDKDRAATQPYAAQRDPDRFGLAETYGWSTDKTRQ